MIGVTSASLASFGRRPYGRPGLLPRTAPSPPTAAGSAERALRDYRTAVLLPDLTGDDYSALETTVLALVPMNPEQLADIEQAVEVASADPENRRLLVRITDRLPSRTQLAGLTPWAIFVMVTLEMLKVAPEINPNDIGVLTMILMVVLYLLPPRAGS